MSGIPSEPPPSYDDVAGSSSSSRPQRAQAGSYTGASHLDVPHRNGIPPPHRRSMEDERRPLPKGWVRSYDPQQNHQFFVDTTKDPPTSIWHHPYDDDAYLATLSTEERERLEQQEMGKKHPSIPDIMAEDTDGEADDHYEHHDGHGMPAKNAELPPRGNTTEQPKGIGKWGRRMKDKVTNSTHEQRESERAKRAEEERKAYEQHMVLRKAMSEAMRTGKAVKVGRDKNGKDVYVEPPQQQPYQSPYGNSGYGYSPYAGGYGSPYGGYRRPMGYGYGGGYGMPLGLGIGGGLMGGLLLGDMMGGGFGGGGFGC